jgi:hypothetical protein
MVMVDTSGIGGNRVSATNRAVGFEAAEKGNTARTMVHLSMLQYRTGRLTRKI